MSILIHVALLGYPLYALAFFTLLSPRRAMIATYLAGWLFLPQSGYDVPALPNYEKPEVVAVAALLGVLVFDMNRLTRFRFSWFDLPILIFCLWPFPSNVVNGNGPLSGINWVISQTCLWGIPYYLGRIYVTDAEDIRDFAIGIFLGGLIYAPLCWYEIRMSPHLHESIYGFFQHSFRQHMRYGGFRPILFMQHGIMVGNFMAFTTLVGLWLWQTGIVKQVSLGSFGRVRMTVLVPFMLLTTIFCKVGTAVFLFAMGAAVFVGYRRGFGPIALATLALVPPTYIFVRTTGVWSGRSLTSAVARFDEERAGSLDAHMRQEDVYTRHALNSPLFGYSDADFIPRNEAGEKLTRGNDAYWIITFAMYGGVSLICWVSTLILPALMMAAPRSAADGSDADKAMMVVLALIVLLFCIDCLVNGMVNPIYLLCAGAVSSGSAAPAAAGYEFIVSPQT